MELVLPQLGLVFSALTFLFVFVIGFLFYQFCRTYQITQNPSLAWKRVGVKLGWTLAIAVIYVFLFHSPYGFKWKIEATYKPVAPIVNQEPFVHAPAFREQQTPVDNLNDINKSNENAVERFKSLKE